jgi:hypothetical protein
MLTHEDVVVLSRPFPLEAHEWRKGRNNKDYVYITESGVVARLNEVDPSWMLVVTDRVEREYSATRKNSSGEAFTVTTRELAITVSLTVKEVTRYGIGMAEVAPDAAEADKSAVTDALKRAARLFGIGGYLLNNPPGKAQFPQWLAKQGMSIVGRPAPASNGAPVHSLEQRVVDVISVLTTDEGGLQFQVSQRGGAVDEADIVLSRAQVEQLRDGGAVSGEDLNSLIGRARAEGGSASLELTRPAEVTYYANGAVAFAEAITLLDAPRRATRRAH